MPTHTHDEIKLLKERIAGLEMSERRRKKAFRRAMAIGGGTLVAVCLLFAGGAAAWTSVLGLFTFNANTPAKASEINHNFEVLEGEVLAKVNAAGDTMSGDLTVGAKVTADTLETGDLNLTGAFVLDGEPMHFAKMRVWRTSNDTIHFIDPTGVERTYNMALVTCNTSATVDNNPPTSTNYLKLYTVPTCYISDPGPPIVWSPMDTNTLMFNITGASSTDCTLLYDDGGGRFNLWVEDDNTAIFGPGTTYFAMQGIDGTSSVSTKDPIGKNESFYIVCF